MARRLKMCKSFQASNDSYCDGQHQHLVANIDDFCSFTSLAALLTIPNRCRVFIKSHITPLSHPFAPYFPLPSLMHPSRSLFLALLFTHGYALPLNERVAIHESREIDATRLSQVDRNAILPLRIGLRQENLDDGYEHLLRVADPASPEYGKHWSREEVESMYAPSSQTIGAVKSWLVASGIPSSTISQSLNRGWLALDIPVWQAEALLGATYYEYESTHDGTLRIGCHEYGCFCSLEVPLLTTLGTSCPSPSPNMSITLSLG